MLELPDFIKKQILVFVPKDGDKITYSNDNLVIKDKDGKIKYQCTCYRIFALLIIGNVSITSGVIMRAVRFKYSVCLMNTSLRTYHIIANGLEGNTILHEKQYSVFEIDNSQRILNNISAGIKNNFEKLFTQADSVYIFELSKTCKVTRYGYAKNEESDFLLIQ